jgi:hypothetical protein
VAPRSLRIAAIAPRIPQALIDRLGFPGTTIQDAIALIPRR